jgi:mxaD protein
VRVLTLKDGGTIKEKLLSFDAAGRYFRYAIVDGVLPVSGYESTFVVKPMGRDRSMVVWAGRFKRKNPAANPGDLENDKAAVTAVSGVYRAGLDNLRKLAEAK